MSDTVKSQLELHVNKFVDTIEDIVRKLALESVEQILGASPKAVRNGAKPVKAKAKGGASGVKRDPNVIAKLVEKLYTTIKAKPGQRIELIATMMKVPTSELTLPVKKLVKEKRIRTAGEKRATTYHLVAAKAKKPAKAKAKKSAKKPAKANGTPTPVEK